MNKAYTVQLIDNPIALHLPPVAVCQCVHAPVSGFGAGATQAQRIASAYGEALERDAIWSAREDFVGPRMDGYIVPQGLRGRAPGDEHVEWAYFAASDGGRHVVHRPTRGSHRTSFYTPLSLGCAVHSDARTAMASALDELRERAVLQQVLSGSRRLAVAAVPDVLATLADALLRAGWDIQLSQCPVGGHFFALAIVVARTAPSFSQGALVAGAKVRDSSVAALAGALHEAVQLIECLYLDPGLTTLSAELTYYVAGKGRDVLPAWLHSHTIKDLAMCEAADPLEGHAVLYRTQDCAGLAFVETIAPALRWVDCWKTPAGIHPYPI